MNPDHLKILQQGAAAWNAWRAGYYVLPDLIEANLSGADLSGADLSGANLIRANLIRANFSGANLSRADLSGADLIRANLTKADLSGANLGEANLSWADLSRANLPEANLTRAKLNDAELSWANLTEANLSGADLSRVHLIGADLIGADLSRANLIRANFSGADLIGAKLNDADLSGANLGEANLSWADLSWADLSGADLRRASLADAKLRGVDLTGCYIYGIAAWGLKLDKNTRQRSLIITPEDEPQITVDNLEVAQFVYLLLHNEKIRDVIDTITTKVVLILGRFTDGRKRGLDALRERLRKHNYLPILFDFDKPAGRDITETVSLLARMARFVVADITDAKSIPQELAVIVPDLPSVPVQPLLLEGSSEYGMFEHFRRYPWVLKPYRYKTQEQLIANLVEKVIRPAEAKVLELRQLQPG